MRLFIHKSGIKKALFLFAVIGVTFSTHVVFAGQYDDLRKEVKARFVFRDVSFDEMDTALMSSLGELALAMPRIKWKSAETEHFVIHYERKTFATHVARLAEFLYHYIAKDLQIEPQNEAIKGRSHIYIFRTRRQWREFLIRSNSAQIWAFSFVYGPEMFLQRAGSKNDSSSVLAHEMTHLIIYRFFGLQPPLWLNEGLASWYEEFGYSAFKGVKKSKKAPFSSIKKWSPLGTLIHMTAYPRDVDEVALFYKSSKYLTGFLLLKYPSRKMTEFIQVLLDGQDVERAFNNVYSIANPDFLEDKFKRFAR